MIDRLEEEYGESMDPVERLIRIAATKDVQTPDGIVTGIPLELRMEAWKAAAPYVRAKLATVQVTGRDGGPVEHAVLGMVLQDPAMVEAAEKLSLAMDSLRREQARQTPAGQQIVDVLPSPQPALPAPDPISVEDFGNPGNSVPVPVEGEDPA